MMKKTKGDKYLLKLYISGSTLQSQKALTNLKRVCDEYIKDSYELQVIDVYQNPSLARDEQILAVPTLVKKHPMPMKKFIGDLSNESKLITGLDLKPKNKASKKKMVKKKK